MSTVIEARFWNKVDKSGDCWLWTASQVGAGYGQCTVAPKKQGYAHRYSYELVNGPIPAGMHVDHVCLNRLCVRPAHLRLATPKQNGEHHAGAYNNSKTGLRGVVPHRSQFVAQVRHYGQTIYVGSFDTAEAAAEAARLMRLELFTHNDTDRRVG